MPEFDSGFKIAARCSGLELCRVGGLACDRLEPISDTVQTTERLADRAFLGRHGGARFVVYFEAYTQWRNDVVWGILAKSGLLSERERLPTRTLVFVLTPQRYREQHGTFRLESEGEATQQVWFREILLWRERPEPWWEQVPGLMALLPLCAHGLNEEDAVTQAAQTIMARVNDTSMRADLLTTLFYFGKLASPAVDVWRLIGVENMRESNFFEEIEAFGRLVQSQVAIMEALAVRFGPEAAEEFKEPLKSIKDIDKLSELHKLAIKTRGLGPFRRALRTSAS